MQEGASFNMSALKAELEKKMEQCRAHPVSKGMTFMAGGPQGPPAFSPNYPIPSILFGKLKR